MSQLPTSMRACVLTAPRRLEIQERRLPVPADDEVLIAVTAVGVCGSDVHFWHEGRLGDWVVNEPLVLGHESGGRIVAVGAQVSSDRIGQRVSIEPQRPHPSSAETLAGHYNLDPAMHFYAVPGTDGAFAEYVTIQSHFAWPVPNSVSDDAAALLEPLSVAIATARKAHFAPGDRILIAGAGPIGILIAQTARAYGASDIYISDPSQQRRDQALALGATHTLDPQTDTIGELGLAVDAFIDASGAASAVRQGILEVRSAGHVVLVGMGAAEFPLPITVIQNRELLVTGAFRYANTWPTAIDLVRRGLIDLDSMVTGHFGLSDVDAALASTTQPGVLKSIVTPQTT
jgi:L-iditol 2-dehydrogenase